MPLRELIPRTLHIPSWMFLVRVLGTLVKGGKVILES